MTEGVPSLESLYARHARLVTRWASRLGGPGVDAEDVMQEVFLIAHRQLPRFEARGEVTSWLFGITRKVVASRRRREKRRGIYNEEQALRQVDPGLSPEERAHQLQTTQRVYAALDGLSERYRSPLVLFELEGMSGEDIAQLLGIRLSNVWVLLHRARAQFLKRLQSLYPEGGWA